jgi:hypothetical protein
MKALLIVAVILLSGCQAIIGGQQYRKGPQVYTTPGSPGGVSFSKYEVTRL